MMKLMGAACILGGGAWARWLQLSAGRQRRMALSGMTAALQQMAEEVRMARTPMPALLTCLGRSRTGAEGAFFRSVSEHLKAGLPLPEAWGQALGALPLPESALAVLAELGRGLQGDEEKVCKAILLTTGTLEKQLDNLEKQRPEAERRATALWFSGAAMLVILLI